MAFKRVKSDRSAFNMYIVKLSPKLQEKYKDVYTEKGVFELKEQTAQVRFYSPVDIPFADLGNFSRTVLAVREPATLGKSVRVEMWTLVADTC